MPRFTNEELEEIYGVIRAEGHHGLANELYWWNNLESYSRAKMPEIRAVMNCPLRKVPPQINRKEAGVATIAKWRLGIGK
jgi:hypothetical protein